MARWISVSNSPYFPPPWSVVAEKSEKISSVAWAVFLIWAGIAMLSNLPWGWFLLGVGILILTTQFARWLMDVNIEGVWVACGGVFLVGGLWTLLELPWPLAPISDPTWVGVAGQSEGWGG